MKVVVIGCGVVGAAISYELSQVDGLAITVLDQQPPARAATGAALGVLMGIISHKVKGRTWQLREASIRRYATLIPEIEAQSGIEIPRNRHGILSLCFTEKDLARWQTLQATRQAQGWPLEILDRSTLAHRCPHLCLDRVIAGIYSPQDSQVDPTQLTLALVKAAQQHGVEFHWQTQVQGLGAPQTALGEPVHCETVQTITNGVATNWPADWVVVSAGLGSMALTHGASQSLPLVPVLGQALRLRVAEQDGFASPTAFQPVVNGEDIHLVPLGDGEYWVGATVEFPPQEESANSLENQDPQQMAPEPSPERLQQALDGAIALYPALARAQILKTWSGLRPRPQGQPAPVLGPLAGYNNVLLATGHYRNGVLLAPATAQIIRDKIVAGRSSLES